MLEHVVAWMADELPKIPMLSSLDEKCNDVFTDDSSAEKSKKHCYQLRIKQSFSPSSTKPKYPFSETGADQEKTP